MKKFNEMTKKDIEQKLEELELHNQEVFIDKLLTDVEFLQEKAIKTSYKPTNYERTSVITSYSIHYTKLYDTKYL